MWHIKCKVSEKVGSTLAKNVEFRGRLNCFVWSNYLGHEQFESGWDRLMKDILGWVTILGLHNCLRCGIIGSQFFFFSHLFMSGLLRTTSRSESENRLFGSFTTSTSSLVEFLLHYDSAIDA